MKILVTGPESSGKTTISNWISKYYNIPLVMEVARPYLDLRNGQYNYNSLHEIVLLQRFEQLQKCSHNTCVHDTDLLTIIIWAQEVFGSYDESWLDMWKLSSNYDLILLCKPDIPWEPDALRENPYDRDRLFDVYRSFLTIHHKEFVVLSGSLEDREKYVNLTINS